MITCTPSAFTGVMNLVGVTPNGQGVVQREAPGASPFLLRGGVGPITVGGISLVDTEAPFGVPLTYRVTVSAISSANRLVQQNLMLTPTFLHGVQGWTAGSGRTLSVVADAAAHSAAGVGKVTSTGTTTTPTTPPSLIGHKDTAVTVSGSYTLDPATPSGGGAIATNDWMLIIHSQLSSAANPADPSGWTRIDDVTANGFRRIIWKRKRQAGDTSYTVAAASGAQSLGSLLWVRGSGDTLTMSVTTLPDTPGVSTTLTTSRHAVVRPSLVVSTFTASGVIGQRAGLIAQAQVRADGVTTVSGRTAIRGVSASVAAAGQVGAVAGGTINYLVNSASSPRTLVVATTSQVDAGDSPYVTMNYGGPVAMGFATQVAFQVADVLTNRTVAVAKAALIPATTADKPHLISGRFRFLHPGLWTWQDVYNQGTWQNLKNTKATWLDVRGSSSTVPGNFLSLFLTIVDPATGNDLIPPQKVLTGLDIAVNTWLDFSMLVANTVDIPTTAEIRLVHGSTLKEFGIEWYFDEFGITPGAQRVHPTLYWFDGDTPLPSDPEDLMMGDSSWSAASTDAAVTWAGTVGNSVSELRMASSVTTTSTCQMAAPSNTPCEPVLLSDPTNVNLSVWAQLLQIGDITYPANRAISRVLSRAKAVAISQIRSDAQTELLVSTDTLEERSLLLSVLGSGRVLQLRNPDPLYPETDWYISIGDVTEGRPIPDHRRPERTWALPVVRVDRPTGLIEASGAVTWADVLALGTWTDVLADRDSWLEVLVGGDV